MNKKLKKALYMFGFVLPIVAIPIITVACGTQTSQITPKEADKNQNEQTPKQETPIQNENKKVVVSSSLSSSKIYDENLLNSNVIELFKLFEQKSYLEDIKKIIEEILKELKNDMNTSEKLDMLRANQVNKLEQMLKNLETSVNSINIAKIKSIINEIAEKAKLVALATKAEAELSKATKIAKEVNEPEEVDEKELSEAAELEGKGKGQEDQTEEQQEEVNEIELEKKAEELEKKIEEAKAAKEEAIVAKAKAEEKASKTAKAVDESKVIKIINESFNEIEKYISNLYKKLFLDESKIDAINFNALKYNNFLFKFSEVKLINFFNIENLKNYLQNLTDDNKLNKIVLKDIFNKNTNNVIETLKKDKEIKSDLIISNSRSQDYTNSLDKLIYNVIRENDPTTFEKIKGDLEKDLTKLENIKPLIDKLIFSDLFDVAKLQEKLSQ